MSVNYFSYSTILAVKAGSIKIKVFPNVCLRSACTSASLEPSYVLRAIGADEDLAHSSIRYKHWSLYLQSRFQEKKNTFVWRAVCEPNTHASHSRSISNIAQFS